MPPPADLPLADATVLVAGAGTFTGGLEDVPAVRRTVTDLARLLRRRCGVPADGLRELVDPGTPVELGDAVAQAADDATGPLLLYYVGHGLVGTTGQLHLSAACSDPRPTRVAHTALAYDVVRQALLRSPGRPLVVLLDCCYSGLAVGGALGAGVADATSIDGGFVLTAAGGDELAWAPPGARYTAFGGRLIGLLRDGDASLPAQLTLRDVYRHLARELPALGLPRPRKRSSEQAESLRLCANPRRPATTGRGPAAANPPRAVPDTRCPYKGLAAFDVDDAQFFFGRTALTARLAAEVAARYDDPDIVVLAGVSGAGKSSLLQAGLRPALRRGALAVPGSTRWPAATCTPTADPLAGLAGAVAALCPAVGRDAAALAGRLRAAPGEVAAEVRAGLSGRDARALLVVDQCEEVFTECRDEADRLAFLSALAALSGGARPAALVVVGVRADFLGRCAAYPPLADALQRHLVVAGPMAADELREAITGPAHEVGITLEDGLVDLLLAELRTGDPADPPAAGDAGRLPLLSHALLATWERHRDARLTVADYRATGGIRGALAATADRAMLSLDGPGRRTAELLLRRLVRIGDGVDDTRRRASLAALRAELPDPAATDAVITAFTARGTRLLTVSDDAVQITHEALLNAWPTLRRWITSGREGLLVEQHLADAAAAWEALGREDAALYAGSRLDRALEWFQDPDHRDRLGPLPRAFLAASQALLETQRADERRRARLRTALTAALGVLLGVSAVAATLALRATGRAQASERTMKIDALLTQAQAVRTSDPSLSLRLGLAAHAVRPDRGSRTALLRTLLDSRFAGELPARYPDEVRGVAASADGRTLLVGGREKPTQVWDTTDPHQPRPLAELPHPAGWVTGDTYAIALSPDGRTALDGNSVWDLTDRAHPRPLAYLPRRPDPPERPGAEPFPSSEYASWAVAYHAGRRLGLTAGGFPADDTRGRAVLWDLSRPAAPRRLGELSGHTGPVWAAAFSPDGRTVVTGSNATAATVWDVTAPRRPRRRADLPGHPGPVWTVAVSARGTVATGSDDGIAVLWSLAGAAPRRLGEVAGHSGPVWVTAFSADGRHLVTGARSDTNAVLWDVTDPRRPLRLGAVSQNEVVSGAVFAGRGPWFHTGGLQGGVRRWSVADPLRPGARPAPADPSSVDATGTLVVTSPLHPDVPAALWRLADGAPPRRLASLPDNPYPAALDDAGRLLATSSGRAARAAAWVDVRDPARPRPLATLPDLDVEALSPDGGYAVATDDSGGAVVVDLTSPASPQVVARLPDAGAVTVSADARTLVADGGDGPHTVWSLDDPRRPQRLYRVSGYQVAPAPGRRFFLDHPADKPYVVLLRPGPDGPVPVQQLDGRAPVLSRDGRLVLTQHDRRAVLWDLADVRHPYRVAVLDGVPPTALTPDARWLLAPGGLYDIGRIRDVLADPVAQACAVAQHGLSAPQWREYAADLPPQPTCVAAHAVG